MSIEISGEIETRLTDEARRLGITVEALLARLVDVGGVHGERGEQGARGEQGERAAKGDDSPAKPELPAWQLGAVGALHRRDIYDDGR
jgi:hypothetical protein